MSPLLYLTDVMYNHKSGVKYLNQLIVSVHGMSGCENINTLDDMIKFITLDNSIRTPSNIDFSGRRVDIYYDIHRLCYGLLQQRQFLSRDGIEFKCIDKSIVSIINPVISLLHANRSHDGLYAKARNTQQREVEEWFGKKECEDMFPTYIKGGRYHESWV